MAGDASVYRWRGLGAACAAPGAARDALLRMLAVSRPLGGSPDWAEAKRDLARATGEAGQEPVLDEKSFSAKMSAAEYGAAGGKPALSLFQMLRHRLRILTGGLMLGSRQFIEARYRDAPPGSYEAARRRRTVREAPCGGLCYACRRANRIGHTD